MNPLRKKRLYIVLAILAGVGIAVALALSALRENINLFYTPTQIAGGEAPFQVVARDTRDTLYRRHRNRVTAFTELDQDRLSDRKRERQADREDRALARCGIDDQ